jgi:hypothetical protein
MALALDQKNNYQQGIVRCITDRIGDVRVKGYVDRSELYRVDGNSLEYFKIGKKLQMKNESKILNRLVAKDEDFIGFEDPDIWHDEKLNQMHVYFTVPIIPKDKTKKIKIHLGHAVGENLDSLEMTMPVLNGFADKSAKELAIAPVNKKGFRFNLIESRDRSNGTTYSVVMTAIAKDMNGPWQYGKIVCHPGMLNIPWIGGHASPGPLFSQNFINVGEGKVIGLMNGREADKVVGETTTYGMFSIGLFLYDYENGIIDWISPEPFIRDDEAQTITFASQFIETGRGEGILYAHVDDSFVRAYTLKANLIKRLLPSTKVVQY